MGLPCSIAYKNNQRQNLHPQVCSLPKKRHVLTQIAPLCRAVSRLVACSVISAAHSDRSSGDCLATWGLSYYEFLDELIKQSVKISDSACQAASRYFASLLSMKRRYCVCYSACSPAVVRKCAANFILIQNFYYCPAGMCGVPHAPVKGQPALKIWFRGFGTQLARVQPMQE